MFISIIVPAFNVEPYIERCIESICHQDMSPEIYEIILVNDGSTDSTLLKIKGVISKYRSHNIKLIDKPNGGLSSARNAGMQCASGDYIWFVDSDDYIAHNCLMSIYHDINNYKQLDVLAFNMEYVYDDGHSARNDRRLDEKKYLTGSELYLKDFRYPYSGVQFSIYKRSYIKSLELNFKEGILFEDILYTTLLLSSNPQCVFINRVYYHYLIRSGSITNSRSTTKKCKDIISVADELHINTTRQKSYNPIVIYDMIARMTTMLYRYHMPGLTLRDKISVIKEITKRKYWLKSVWISKKYKYTPYIILNIILRPLVYFLR